MDGKFSRQKDIHIGCPYAKANLWLSLFTNFAARDFLLPMRFSSEIDLSGPSLLEICAFEAFRASDAGLFDEL